MRKRKGKDIVVDELPKKKKVIDEETLEYVKTLKRSDYFVVEKLKKLPAQISILSYCYRRKGIEWPC